MIAFILSRVITQRLSVLSVRVQRLIRAGNRQFHGRIWTPFRLLVWHENTGWDGDALPSSTRECTALGVVCGDPHTKNQLDPLRCTIRQRHKQTDTQPQRVVLAEPLPRSTNNIHQWSESVVCVSVWFCYSRPRFTCARFDYESAVQVFRLRTCMFNFS